jgi:hypothetical protein
MAKALKCPACGATHRLDDLNGATKFRCDECGQSLKVPNVQVTTPSRAASDPEPEAAPASATDDSVLEASAPNGSATDAPVSDTAASDASEPAEPMKLATAAVPPPPPRRRAPGAPRGREIVGASATLSVSDGDAGGGAPVSTLAPEREPTTRRRRVRWYWRILAWIAAIPIGFVITVWPAYEFGLIRKDDVLDVFVGSGAGRYTRLAIVTVLWALVTALLVQLFVEGGRWWAARRRERADSPPRHSASAAAS